MLNVIQTGNPKKAQPNHQRKAIIKIFFGYIFGYLESAHKFLLFNINRLSGWFESGPGAIFPNHPKSSAFICDCKSRRKLRFFMLCVRSLSGAIICNTRKILGHFCPRLLCLKMPVNPVNPFHNSNSSRLNLIFRVSASSETEYTIIPKKKFQTRPEVIIHPSPLAGLSI